MARTIFLEKAYNRGENGGLSLCSSHRIGDRKELGEGVRVNRGERGRCWFSCTSTEHGRNMSCVPPAPLLPVVRAMVARGTCSYEASAAHTGEQRSLLHTDTAMQTTLWFSAEHAWAEDHRSKRPVQGGAAG